MTISAFSKKNVYEIGCRNAFSTPSSMLLALHYFKIIFQQSAVQTVFLMAPCRRHARRWLVHVASTVVTPGTRRKLIQLLSDAKPHPSGMSVHTHCAQVSFYIPKSHRCQIIHGKFRPTVRTGQYDCLMSLSTVFQLY